MVHLFRIVFFLWFLAALAHGDELTNAQRASSLAGYRCLGVRCRDGAVLMSATKKTTSTDQRGGTRLATSTRRVHAVDGTTLCALAGLSADCSHVVQFLQGTANDHRTNFGVHMPLPLLTEALSDYLHDWTQSGSVRPLAVSCLLAGRDGLVHVAGDGGVRHIVAGATDTADADEDAALAAALAAVQQEGAGWAGLGVDEAVGRVRAILRALAVDNDDNSTGKAMSGSGGDENSGAEGNRAHELSEWSAVTTTT